MIEAYLRKFTAFTLANQDKVFHSFYGCWISIVALVIASGLHHHYDFHWRVTCMIAAPCVAGVVKEIYDAAHPAHTADKWDIFAAIIGAVPVWAAYYLGGVK